MDFLCVFFKHILIPLQQKIEASSKDNTNSGSFTANEFKLNSRVCQCTLYASKMSFQNSMRCRFGLVFVSTPLLVMSM